MQAGARSASSFSFKFAFFDQLLHSDIYKRFREGILHEGGDSRLAHHSYSQRACRLHADMARKECLTVLPSGLWVVPALFFSKKLHQGPLIVEDWTDWNLDHNLSDRNWLKWSVAGCDQMYIYLDMSFILLHFIYFLSVKIVQNVN